MQAGDSNSQQWAWLGLLKWSLSYTDGTHDSPAVPMDPEKRAFLEAVMKDGIIDENKRMKEILEQMTTALETIQRKNEGGASHGKDGDVDVDADALIDALDELRDIVEQIDYARNFCAMQGLPFLLGCIQERQAVPEPIRLSCLGILATLCQNNPPVQRQLLDIGSIKILSDLFFMEHNASTSCQLRILQAISANVRNDQLAEAVFCQLPQACHIFDQGLQGDLPLQKRTLFLLRALVTSDFADPTRVQLFSPNIALAVDRFLDPEVNFEVRELSLELINMVLEQRKSVNVLLGERRNRVVHVAVHRVAALRKLEGDDREFAAHELDEWEKLLIQLPRAEPDVSPSDAQEILMIGPAEPAPESLPQ